MKMCCVQNSALFRMNSVDACSAKSFKASTKEESLKGVNGEVLNLTDKDNVMDVENISNKKVGSKFIVTFKDPKYDGLKILVKPGTTINSRNGKVSLRVTKQEPTFTGRVYGSIRNDENGSDEKMKQAYRDYWSLGMHNLVSTKYIDKGLTSKIKDDYNFFIPSDGDGTRYKDITTLQGGITKPASLLPAQLNGRSMSLVQTVLTNFAKTDKLDKGVGFVEVEPAKGSAYAFLEGLKDDTIPTNKPLVFSWGDNFSDINVPKIILDHESKNSGFTAMSVLADAERVKSLGVFKVNNTRDMNVDWFKEKPQDDDEVKSLCYPELGGKCIASVGPYVMAPEVLKEIKKSYTENPDSFLSPEGKGYDFSSMIIAPLAEKMNNGEIKDTDGNELKMRTILLPKGNTWSDLGSEKDFSKEMKSIKHGGYTNLPEEMRTSIKSNVDYNGNITFNKKTKEQFQNAMSEYGLSVKNAVCYSKEETSNVEAV